MSDKIILGFDISSTCIGYAILKIKDDNSIQFVACDFLKPIKHANILHRLQDTKKKIQLIIDKYQPTHISIEDIIQFIKGKSSAKTIITLACFNRMIGTLCFDYLGHSPTLSNVNSIRASLKIDKSRPNKFDMPKLLEQHLNIKFPFLYKKNGEIKPESFDMSDAVCVALHTAFILTNKKKIK